MPIQHITAGNLALQAVERHGPLAYERKLHTIRPGELAQIVAENYTIEQQLSLATELASRLGLVIGPAFQPLTAQLQAITPTQLVDLLTEVWNPDQRWEFGLRFTESFKW